MKLQNDLMVILSGNSGGNMQVKFREIQPSDNKELAEMIRKIFREFKIDMPGTVYTDPTTDALYELFQTPGSAYFIAEENGRIVGGCGFYPTNGLPHGYAELVKFYVAFEARGKGTGKELMIKTIEEAKKAGYTHIYLESFPNLTKAIEMYHQTGFKKIAHALGNSGHYSCNVWMVKDLNSEE